MARLKEIVVDAAHPAVLARFWAAALTGYAVRPYDDAEIARLAELGLTPETDPAVMVDGPGGLSLCFQKVEEMRPKGRLHLDIVGQPRTEEIPRLERLGARVREVRDSLTIMLDPEGNAFCVHEPR